MVKYLNIRKNIGKTINRSISKIFYPLTTMAPLAICASAEAIILLISLGIFFTKDPRLKITIPSFPEL